jgi:hypothetical protein
LREKFKYTSKCIFRHMRLHPPISYLDAARNGSKQSERKEVPQCLALFVSQSSP